MKLTVSEWVPYAQVISSAAIGVSALVAASVFAYTRKVNRQRATLDMVMRTFLDDSGKDRNKEFKSIIKRHYDKADEFSIIPFATPSRESSQERTIIMRYLNEYELIALGIRRKVFDEQFYKLWFHGQFMKDVDDVMELIDEIQKQRPSSFCEIKILYRKWKKVPHPFSWPNKIQIIWWVLSRNEEKIKSLSLIGKSA